MILVEDLKEVVHTYDILEQRVVVYLPDEVWVIEPLRVDQGRSLRTGYGV